MAAFFLLLTILVGVVLGDALVENDGAGVFTVFGQTTGRFNQGQLLLVFAGLGFLFALLLMLSLASTRRLRTRRKERRSGKRELGERITELERDNARLQDDLTQRDDALAGREAELAHRDRQLALKDEELARRDHELAGPRQELAQREEDLARHEQELARHEQELHQAGTPGTPEAPTNATPAATELLDQPSAPATEVVAGAAVAPAEGTDQTVPAPTEVLDRAGAAGAEAAELAAATRPEGAGRTSGTGAIARDVVLSPEETEPVAPLHDEPPWLAEAGGDEEPTSVTSADEERTRPVDGADRAPDDQPARRTEKPDQNS